MASSSLHLGGRRHLIIDVAVNHEFGGDHLADVSRNGALRDAQPSRILERTARTKVDRSQAPAAPLRAPRFCVAARGLHKPEQIFTTREKVAKI